MEIHDDRTLNCIDFSALRKLSKISSLSLYCCNITTIEPHYFSGMRRLKVLSISSRLESIKTSDVPWDNVGLTDLYLTQNGLKEIRENTFRGLTALEILNLNDNRLLIFEITSFSGLNNLRFVDLSFSSIIRLSVDISALESIILGGSWLGPSCLSPGRTFNFTKSLKYLFLSDAHVQTSGIYDHVKKISLFQGLHNLTKLDVSKNYIYVLVSGMFGDLSSLKELSLGESNILSIESDTFSDLNSLQKLTLDYNLIKVVTFNMVRDLTHLRSLSIEGTDIYFLEMNLFRNNPSLSSLNLANNHLVGFNKSTFQYFFTKLEEIDISHNSIVCDCSSKWLVDWLSGPIKIKHEQMTFCSPVSATLGPLRGKRLMTLASTKLCHPQITGYLFVALSLLNVFVILLVIYWHRWFLRHKLFLLKLAVIGYKEFADSRRSDQFEYALNIISTDDCKEWIQQHFRPFLEGIFPDKGKVVFGDADLKLGMHYLDAVMYTVEHSFKTVLFLSRAAVQDHLFMTKFRLAMDYATDIGTENLILIFVEDILDEELPYPVKLFLSGSGSDLSWVDDEADQEYFWEQLQKYLNVNRKMNHLHSWSVIKRKPTSMKQRLLRIKHDMIVWSTKLTLMKHFQLFSFDEES